jgi:hypothetical protein
MVPRGKDIIDAGVMTKSIGLQSAYGHTYEGSVCLFHYIFYVIIILDTDWFLGKSPTNNIKTSAASNCAATGCSATT